MSNNGHNSHKSQEIEGPRDDARKSRFANLVVEKSVSAFGFQDVKIVRLTPNQLVKIQEKGRELAELLESKKEDEVLDDLVQFKALFAIVREGTPEMRDMSDSALCDLPIADLKEHAEAIMEYSGMGKELAAVAQDSMKS